MAFTPVSVWQLRADMAPDAIATCYGIKTEARALELARGWVACGMVDAVTVTHVTKDTARGRWKQTRQIVRA